jgi:sugar/nucleoside kinase (ribokinase family)
MNTKTPFIMSAGSALMDLLLQETDTFVSEGMIPKGDQKDVESSVIHEMLGKSSKKAMIVPGGCSCNTIVGLGRLGAKARFVGIRGEDDLGNQLEESLKKNHVEPIMSRSSSLLTGTVLSIVTPDAQRTMYTYLGANLEITPNHLNADQFTGADIVHLDAYLLFNEPVFRAALKYAKEAGAKISLDLAAPSVTSIQKDLLLNVIKNDIDIVIANEDESKAITALSEEKESVRALAELAGIAVVKMGKRGSFIAQGGQVTQVGIMGDGSALDTTGAGDLWNAGFLYGISVGLPFEKAGELGAACGYEVCQVLGASIPDEGWKRIEELKLLLAAAS